jgi:hypothetical protein
LAGRLKRLRVGVEAQQPAVWGSGFQNGLGVTAGTKRPVNEPLTRSGIERRSNLVQKDGYMP